VTGAFPEGTVTFLFTHLADSTRRWEDDPTATAKALRVHDAIVQSTMARHAGSVFDSGGDGVRTALSTPADAAAAAIESQEHLRDDGFMDYTVGMALHTAEATERDGTYSGNEVNRAVRLLLLAHGGQVLVSDATNAGFTRRGGTIVCTYFDENFLNLVPADQIEGLYGCLDYYRNVDDPFSIELLNRYEVRNPGSARFTAGSACTGTYRALKLWEAAVTEAGSLDQDDVILALDHARIAEGPGGPAEMVPVQHHVRMNMYIARSEGGSFKVVENLGHIDPQECEVGRA
jgi:hypothetical protein